MSAGAIIVIAVAATGILMMRFRKRWLAKFNIAVTNRITSLFAGWLRALASSPMWVASRGRFTELR